MALFLGPRLAGPAAYFAGNKGTCGLCGARGAQRKEECWSCCRSKWGGPFCCLKLPLFVFQSLKGGSLRKTGGPPRSAPPENTKKSPAGGETTQGQKESNLKSSSSSSRKNNMLLGKAGECWRLKTNADESCRGFKFRRWKPAHLTKKVCWWHGRAES